MEAAPEKLGPWAGNRPRMVQPSRHHGAERKGRRVGFSLGPALQAQSPSAHRHCTPGRWLGGLAVFPGHEGAPGKHRTPTHMPAILVPSPTAHMSSENINAKAPRSICPSICRGKHRPVPKGQSLGGPMAGTQCSSEWSGDGLTLSPETQAISAVPLLKCSSTPSLECSLYQT